MMVETSLREMGPEVAGQEIGLLGFLAKDQAGDLYLVETPKIKSCCLGFGKQKELRVEGLRLEELPSKAVKVQGWIEVDAKGLKLAQAKLVPEASEWGWALLLLGLLAIITGRYFGRA